jgi:hypothetical protein
LMLAISSPKLNIRQTIPVFFGTRLEALAQTVRENADWRGLPSSFVNFQA